MKDITVNSAEELRSLLIASARAVIDGKLNVQRANAVSALSSEVHKSLRMEIVGQALTNNVFSVENGKLMRLESDVEGRA